MKILLTGASGYIGKRLLPILVEKGHFVVCCVRDKSRFSVNDNLKGHVEVIEIDFLKKDTLKAIPEDVEAAYYLIHSMNSSSKDFEELEAETAENFVSHSFELQIKHVIFLTGIINDKELSKHLSSRKKVEEILQGGNYHMTALRAGIIVGSGSASFEIMRDLVEKLPIMIAPRWLLTRSQPIAIRDVIKFLSLSLMREETFDKNFDITGQEVMTYKEMLLDFAKVRGLKRYIGIVPVMTPRLSSYWLYFITSTSYNLAVSLVESMKVEVIGNKNDLAEILGIEPLDYKSAIKLAFQVIEQNEVVSSWKDSMNSGRMNSHLSDYVKVPDFGCFRDIQTIQITNPDSTLNNIWALGGQTGWYYANWLWKTRGFMDKMVGGIGLKRGRTNISNIQAGDSLDFWRVIFADRSEKRLLLYAEMKLPGEAWLEFKIDKENVLHQSAIFRPKGIWGRLYWFSVLPFHFFIFKGLIKKLAV